MDQTDLSGILERDRAVSRFLECISLSGMLKSFNIPINDVMVELKEIYVGCLSKTQDTILPKIYDRIKRGKWDAPSNEFFKQGQDVDFTKEPIVVYEGDRTRHVLIGHTRAKYALDTQGKEAIIPALVLVDSRLEKFVDSMENIVGTNSRIQDIKFYEEKKSD